MCLDPTESGNEKYSTIVVKIDLPTAKALSVGYTEPTREFNALWKSYEDLSKAATAWSLLNPIAVNCFTTSKSSFSVEPCSCGGVRCEPRLGIGGGFCVSCDFFFFPNGSRILSLEVLVVCSFSFNLSAVVGRGFGGVSLFEGGSW